MQHFMNQNKGAITVEWVFAFAATCPRCQACHIFGIVIANIPCLLLAKPPQSNEKYKGCQAN